jgi:hypothetical protein
MKVRGAAADVVLGEAQAVLAHVRDPERRGRLADLVAAVQEGELDEEDALSLEELLEVGASALSTGPRGSRPRSRRTAGFRPGARSPTAPPK